MLSRCVLILSIITRSYFMRYILKSCDKECQEPIRYTRHVIPRQMSRFRIFENVLTDNITVRFDFALSIIYTLCVTIVVSKSIQKPVDNVYYQYFSSCWVVQNKCNIWCSIIYTYINLVLILLTWWKNCIIICRLIWDNAIGSKD